MTGQPPVVTCPVCCRLMPAHALPVHDCVTSRPFVPALWEPPAPKRRRRRFQGQWRRRILVDWLTGALVWSSDVVIMCWPLLLILGVLLWMRCDGPRHPS